MTDRLTDPPATVCPACLQPIDQKPKRSEDGRTLQERVAEIARKCLGHDPGLDQWQGRRDLA